MDIEESTTPETSEEELKEWLKAHPVRKVTTDTDKVARKNSRTKKQSDRPPATNLDLLSTQRFVVKVGQYKSCHDASRGSETSCCCNKQLVEKAPDIAKCLLDVGHNLHWYCILLPFLSVALLM